MNQVRSSLRTSDEFIRSLVSLLQFHFGLEPAERSFQDTQGDAYRWSSDEVASSIWISDQYPEAQRKGELRPGIIARRSAVTWNNATLGGNFFQGTMIGPESVHLAPVSAQIELQCLSEAGMEAEALAGEVMQLLLIFEEQLRDKSNMHAIQSVRIGAEQVLEIKGNKTEWMMVPCQIDAVLVGTYTTTDKVTDPVRAVDVVYDFDA
jgi:hypothetical protein